MKRYLIFGFDDYYPVGGANDLLGSVDELPTHKEARALGNPFFDNYTVLDTETGEETDL